MPLTVVAIQNAKKRKKAYKIYDTEGLYLLVQPTGAKYWRFKYRFGGKEKLLSLGTYPETSLQVARQRRNEARGAVQAGQNPADTRKQEKAKHAAAYTRIGQHLINSSAHAAYCNTWQS